MDEPDRKDDAGEPEFELGDTAPPAFSSAAHGASQRRFLFQRHLTAAGRTRRVVNLFAIVLLALLLLVASTPDLRIDALHLVSGLLPEPAPAVDASADLFYLVPNVPWGTVLLDGRPLASIPLASDGPPLRLARGQHTFEWHAAPFMPLRCQVSVPDDRTDVCWLDGVPTHLILARAPDGASVIPAHDDLSALPAQQRASLLMATQMALEQSASQIVLRPGERYAFLPDLGSADRTVAATQDLRATLTFHLLSSLGVREPCVIGDPAVQPCRFPGQDCSRFCTLPVAPALDPPVAGSTIWFASTFTWVSWDYATLAGTLVARNQGDPGVNFRLVDLGISWDGAVWHVTPLFGHQANLPSVDDTVCSAARVWLARGPLAPLLPDGDTATAITYFSGPVPAAGCVVRVTSLNPSGTPSTLGSTSALFLVRCGVLVAANTQAHALWPALPLADAAEGLIARQLVAQPFSS